MPRILMVASEAAPFAKTGGLADVLGSLPAALVKRGDEVAVVLPRYRTALIDSSERIWHAMPLSVGSHFFTVAIDQVIRQGVRYLFVDCPPLYDRPGIYNENNIDYPDNHIRFALLNQAAIGVARYIFRPDVFHAHDWQAGLLAPYLRTTFAGDPTFFGSKCVLTIHNLGYQGNFWAVRMQEVGLDPVFYHTEALEFNGMISFLKGGIVFSDAVTTVSPTYAREIQTPEYGFGFDGLLRSRNYKLRGILNGVDYSEWAPETDPYLPARFSSSDLSGKADCKRHLLAEMGLPYYGERPLLGIVSRFADQKGFDLVAEIAGPLAEENISLVVLGSGDKRFEDMFRHMGDRRPDKFGVRIGYDDALAHRIEAACDMFLMPSRYEPCGLNQIYSLRYGTVPIVRATGGLDDTVDSETGFKFSEYSPGALAGAIGQALGAWQFRDAWTERMRRGMAKDFSWEASATEYQRMYAELAST
ncbi:MAG TPA: glycogen synthase GlgA [Bryobacteraceae bacterium]|jgi:starch synthase|nr:glycogen synthase GlgA [Bryobacteraceae bacterium]